MMRALTAASLLALCALSGVAQAASDKYRFYGYAFDLKTDAYLYTEVHEQKAVDEKWVGGTIRYFAPDGTRLGTKTLDFSADPFIPLYQYELPALGYREGITAVGKEVVLTKSDKGGKPETARIPKVDPIAADSGFHSFLRHYFADLLAGKTVAFTFIAAGNLDSYKFRAKRIDDTTFEGKPAVRFLVEANSLLRLVAPSLIVTYEPKEQKLLEYRGPSNVINPDTGKVYDARIAYYDQKPAKAPQNLPPLE
ncbi:MAG: hypothetical protein ACT4P0_07895 [Panacagrimonas sp.]